jgi:hypothetical protein
MVECGRERRGIMLQEIMDEMHELDYKLNHLIWDMKNDNQYLNGKFTKERSDWIWTMTDEQHNELCKLQERIDPLRKRLEKIR